MYNFISNTSRCHYMVPSVPISSFKHQHKCQSKCHCTSYGRHGRFWTPIPLWAVQRMELYRAWNWSIWETKSKCKWNVSDFDHSNIFIIFLVKSTIYNFFFLNIQCFRAILANGVSGCLFRFPFSSSEVFLRLILP